MVVSCTLHLALRTLETNREITKLTDQSKRETWRINLDRIYKLKDAKHTWSSVRSLSALESYINGNYLLYRGRLYVSDRVKVSAFSQDFANISAAKVIMRSRRTAKRHQIEAAFTTGEHQQTCSQLNLDLGI